MDYSDTVARNPALIYRYYIYTAYITLTMYIGKKNKD